MSDIHPDAVSLESEPRFDNPPIVQSQAEPEPQAQIVTDDDAEPEGVQEVAGQRMVSVSVLAAERKRAREAGANFVREKELTPLQAAAQERDQLRAVLAELRPIVEDVRRYGVAKPPAPSKAEDAIPDDRAERYARRFELYDAKTGQHDVARAKTILGEQHEEIQQAAHAAAQAAVGPITSQTAQSQSRQNFVSMAMRRDGQNQPLVDPKELAALWAQLPPDLTQHPEVGELILDAAIGKSIRTTGRVPRAERSPILSEPPGGRTGPQWQMDHMAKNLAKAAGISDKSFTEAGKGYAPGQPNVLGE